MTKFLYGLFAGVIFVMVILNRHPVTPLIIEAEGGNTETSFVVDCKSYGDGGVRCRPQVKEQSK